MIVAEDNDDLRAVMPPLIDDNPDMQCVGVTAYIDEVAPLIEQHQAHVAVLDLELRGGSAFKRLPDLCRQFPGTRFIIHSGHANPELMRQAREAGAGAYVRKSGDIDELIDAIRDLMRQ